MKDSTFVPADGRTLAYTDIGTTDSTGPVVVYFPGAPTSRLDLVAAEAAVAGVGGRIVSADRPGDGGSQAQPGRTVTHHTADVVGLLDHLGIGRFAAAGRTSEVLEGLFA